MIRINLLPHREIRRERRKKEFLVLSGLVVGAGVVAATLVAVGIGQMISTQEARNAFMTTENDRLDNQIKEIASLRGEIQALKARQSAVENLQGDRTMPVHLLDEQVKHTPDGIFFKQVKQEDRRVTMAGYAQSNERVSELLRNLSTQAPWLERPELIEIKSTLLGNPNEKGPNAKEPRRIFEFSMTAVVRNPSQAKPDPAAAAKKSADAGGTRILADAR